MASTSRSSQVPATAKVSDVISNFQPVRRFGVSAGSKPYSITSLDFDDSGELCLVAQDNDALNIYNCKQGKHAKELLSQKYGVDIARFAHHSQSIIYASTKGDDSIRYLSSHDNSYLRYFKGHTAAVTNIALNPSNDTFLSASQDNTVRLWDLRSQSAQGQLNLTTPYLCAYDPTATVMGIACIAAQSIVMYDVRNYDQAPFAIFDLQAIESSLQSNGQSPGQWTKLEFSNDGNRLLVSTAGSGHYILNAFEGTLDAFCARPTGHTNRVTPSNLAAHRTEQQQESASSTSGSRSKMARASSQGDTCFSPDGRYVIGGSGESGLFVWDLKDAERSDAGGNSSSNDPKSKTPTILRPKCELGSGNRMAGSNAVVSYNPRHNLLATANRSLVFWLPEMDS